MAGGWLACIWHARISANVYRGHCQNSIQGYIRQCSFVFNVKFRDAAHLEECVGIDMATIAMLIDLSVARSL